MTPVEAKRAQKTFALSLPGWHWASLIATVGGMGYLPKFEANHFGSLTASLITPLLLLTFGGAFSTLPALLVLIVSCGLARLALHTIHRTGVESDHDASAIVIDEVAGAAVAAIALPAMVAAMGEASTLNMVLCALLAGWVFRFFDVYKPFPCNVIDTYWHHPFAVVADDLVAGFYAMLVCLGFVLLI